MAQVQFQLDDGTPWDPTGQMPGGADPYGYTFPGVPGGGDPIDYGTQHGTRGPGAASYGPAGARSRSGTPQTDWQQLTAGTPYSAQNYDTAWNQFAQWYPGSQRDRGDLNVNGQWVDVIRGFSGANPDWGGWQPVAPGGGGGASPWASQYTDPSQQQFERLLQAQIASLQQQQSWIAQQAQAAQARQAQTGAAADRLTEFINQRVTGLGQPAYTGSEAEVLRTQALDPIESDRQATRQRALERVSARGMTPDSGIAQQLLNDVDLAYDRTRAGAQNDLASRQIGEQRSRDQEAQQLLQYLTQLPTAVAQGDLGFINSLFSTLNQAPHQGLQYAGQQNELGRQSLQDALSALGVAPSQGGLSNALMQMFQSEQANRLYQQQNAAQYWANIGYNFGL